MNGQEIEALLTQWDESAKLDREPRRMAQAAIGERMAVAIRALRRHSCEQWREDIIGCAVCHEDYYSARDEASDLRDALKMLKIVRDPTMNAVWVYGAAAAAHEIERVLGVSGAR